jgi:2-aminoethylphosphonate-pyruvate transaminase
MPQIETAIFLAAGLGSRLKGLTENKPKGFLEIDGIALIERSVQNLLASGIRQFYFGTGFLSEVYEHFACGYNAVCIKNESYADTGSMYTLHNMKDYISNDFILLEADLLYHRDGIRILNEDPHPDAILASGKTYSGDEVFIETDSLSYLVNMSNW